MRKFRPNDIHSIEISPTSGAALRSKLSAVIDNSTLCRGKVETFNPETGQYRIVLQGSLEKDSLTWDED